MRLIKLYQPGRPMLYALGDVNDPDALLRKFADGFTETEAGAGVRYTVADIMPEVASINKTLGGFEFMFTDGSQVALSNGEALEMSMIDCPHRFARLLRNRKQTA